MSLLYRFLRLDWPPEGRPLLFKVGIGRVLGVAGRAIVSFGLDVLLGGVDFGATLDGAGRDCAWGFAGLWVATGGRPVGLWWTAGGGAWWPW